MGKLLEELRHFLSTATKEQLEQAWKEVEPFKDIGPIMTEYIENMKEIKEAYVSFEVAKLLKEKGFNEPCMWAYDPNGASFAKSYYEPKNSELNEYEYSKPTHQMAMKWLREVHKLHIDIWPTYNMETEEHTGWGITVSDLSDFGGAYLGDAGSYKTYEEAVEVALKESLENFV